MTPLIRLTLVLTLILASAAGGWAQEATTAATTTVEETAAGQTAPPEVEDASARSESRSQSSAAVRERFRFLLDAHPPQVSTVLGLEPSLLGNEQFLARYPEIEEFLRQHPEIRRNPHYFVRGFRQQAPPRQEGPLDDLVEALSVMFVVALIAVALSWLIRTVIEQRRWNRLSRQQAEVHNKILDRFASSEEVLAYIRTPAGTKFLESAPIPLRVERPAQPGPMGRVLLSVQIGIIVGLAGLGMMLVSAGLGGQSSHGFFAMGAIAFCVGAGFVASAFVSVVLSRRLGLWQESPPASARSLDEPGVMR